MKKVIPIVLVLALLVYIVSSPHAAAETVSGLIDTVMCWLRQIMVFMSGVGERGG